MPPLLFGSLCNSKSSTKNVKKKLCEIVKYDLKLVYFPYSPLNPRTHELRLILFLGIRFDETKQIFIFYRKSDKSKTTTTKKQL